MKQNTCASSYVPVDKRTSECVLIPAENYFPYRPLVEHIVVKMASAEKRPFTKDNFDKKRASEFTCATGRTYQTVGQSTQVISILELKFLFNVFHLEVL